MSNVVDFIAKTKPMPNFDKDRDLYSLELESLSDALFDSHEKISLFERSYKNSNKISFQIELVGEYRELAVIYRKMAALAEVLADKKVKLMRGL